MTLSPPRRWTASVLVLAAALAGDSVIRPASADRALSADIHRAEAFWRHLDLIGHRGIVLVARDQQTLLKLGTGGLDPSGVFDIASIAKPITAVAILRLAARHDLALSDR